MIAAPILTDYPAAKRSDPFLSRHFANTTAWKHEAIERIVRKLIDVHFPAQPQKRRGRPPKNGVAMSNAER
ncbi:hypothetical protein NKI71_31860 [Mesorhizobium sp. M0510]|uniref:hypothetical protein n=1 Tax=Mesorhizobium sp. M0510 TaxID=2956954 RepID=UPI0033375B18